MREFCIDYGKERSRKRKQDILLLEKELKLIESQLLNTPSDKELSQKHMAVKFKLELQTLHQAKGAQVRSKIKWIEDGEKKPLNSFVV